MEGTSLATATRPESGNITEAPFYIPVGKEVELFQLAHENRLPIILKGPTGTGKTRFLEHMAHRLGTSLTTVACHEDLTVGDLVGRYLLKHNETVWVDGPLTRAVREGGICYLDEVVEARKDTVVAIHPLTDHRRLLPLERLGTILEAHPDFCLVASYNPGYQTILKDLKQSTKQRFVAIELGFPPPEVEREILRHEGGIDEPTATLLVELAAKVRQLKNRGLDEGVSPRLLVYAATLIKSGLPLLEAFRSTIVLPLTDDPQIQQGLLELARGLLGD